MKKFLKISALMIAMLMIVMTLASCMINGKDGKDGQTPYIKDGYWYIGDTNTNIKAEATNGANGQTPYIKDGYWYIGDINTYIRAEAADGEKGNDGANGQTPYIKDGYWYIGDTNTNIKAEAVNGENGQQGEAGLNGNGIARAYINEYRHLILVLTDGTIIDAGSIGENYYVSFNLNYDTNLASPGTQAIIPGTCATAPNIQYRENHIFTGWYIDAACTQKFDFNTAPTSSITLYAGWLEDSYSAQTERQKAELEALKALNNGSLPTIMLSGETYNPSFILGTYSTETVNSFSSAAESLKSVENLMGIDNVAAEYTDGGSSSIGGTTQYRMQQTYNGFTVYGQQIVVTTDASNSVTSLSGDHVSVTASTDTASVISTVAAKASAEAAGYDILDTDEGELVIYTLGGYNELVYVFDDGAYTIIVAADDGEIIKAFSNVMTALPTESGTITSTIGREEMTSNNQFNTVFFDYENSAYTDTFIFYDQQRNILYHDRNFRSVENWLDYYFETPLTDSDNIWETYNYGDAIVLYTNLATTYDFYLDLLGLYSYDGNNGQVLAFVNDGLQNGNNAFNWGPGKDVFSNQNYTLISFGGTADYQAALDIVAHEYTHAIQSSIISNLNYAGQTGSLMEAYSDFMGELVQLQTYGYTDWMSLERNIADPSEAQSSTIQFNDVYLTYPKKINGAGYYTGNLDQGGVHHNSTVISHTLYKIYMGSVTDVAQMTELLYRAWGYLSSTANFYDYKMAMLAAARDMGFDQSIVDAIELAFQEAGITTESIPEDYNSFFLTTVTLDVTAFDSATNSPIIGAHVIVKKTNLNRTIVTESYTDENGECRVDLCSGIYEISIVSVGYETLTRTYLFMPFEQSEISAWLNPEGVNNEGIVCEIGGTVTNAMNNEPLSEVTLNFREGYNVTSGPVELSLLTGNDGKFYTNELDYGYYTVEVSKDGFISAYFVVQAAASNWDNAIRDDALKQVFSISPYIQSDDTLRIVLTWGEYPADLDSHIAGSLANGSRFHVYYSNKNVYEEIDDESVNTANLDIDDTQSFGPETITLHITNLTEVYSYYIHDFTNRNSSYSTSMATSGAKVQVFSGSVLLATYEISANSDGTLWHVFDFDPVTGTLITQNQYSYQSNSGSIGN